MAREFMNYDFFLEVEGIPVLGIQKLDTPDVEWLEARVGTTGRNPDKKIPTKKKVGDLTIENAVGLEEENAIWLAFQKVGTGERSIYAGDGYFVQLKEGAPVARFLATDIWVKKISSISYETKEDNANPIARNIVLSVGDWIPR